MSKTNDKTIAEVLLSKTNSLTDSYKKIEDALIDWKLAFTQKPEEYSPEVIDLRNKKIEYIDFSKIDSSNLKHIELSYNLIHALNLSHLAKSFELRTLVIKGNRDTRARRLLLDLSPLKNLEKLNVVLSYDQRLYYNGILYPNAFQLLLIMYAIKQIKHHIISFTDTSNIYQYINQLLENLEQNEDDLALYHFWFLIKSIIDEHSSPKFKITVQFSNGDVVTSDLIDTIESKEQISKYYGIIFDFQNKLYTLGIDNQLESHIVDLIKFMRTFDHWNYLKHPRVSKMLLQYR